MEAYLVTLFKDSNLCAIQVKGITVCSRGVLLARHIRDEPIL